VKLGGKIEHQWERSSHVKKEIRKGEMQERARESTIHVRRPGEKKSEGPSLRRSASFLGGEVVGKGPKHRRKKRATLFLGGY